MRIINQIFLFIMVVFTSSLNAEVISSGQLIDTLRGSPTELVSSKVQEHYLFYGLASYYNNVNYFIVEHDKMIMLNLGDSVELKQGQWLAAVGRFNILLIQKSGILVQLNESDLVIDNPELLGQEDAVVKMTTKSELPLIAPELDQIRYAHLWGPLAWLAKMVESSLILIQANIVSSWGWAIVIFSILLKLLLLPVGMMTVRFQRRVSQVQAKLAPKLVEIKANYDGEEAHNHLMDAHKELGVSPFYSLKPMLGSFIQIPILIATFNALGEMPQFVGQSFLWIGDLAYPDVIAFLPLDISIYGAKLSLLPTNIPLFGNVISLLPFIMTVVTIYSTIIFQNPHATKDEVKRQKRNLYLMAIAFLVLFYPFPAVMVLYWVLANTLQTIQQQIVKI